MSHLCIPKMLFWATQLLMVSYHDLTTALGALRISTTVNRRSYVVIRGFEHYRIFWFEGRMSDNCWDINSNEGNRLKIFSRGNHIKVFKWWKTNKIIRMTSTASRTDQSNMKLLLSIRFHQELGRSHIPRHSKLCKIYEFNNALHGTKVNTPNRLS
jgi:hypothetical protein